MATYYYARSNDKYGPFTAAGLRELAASGQLLPTDLVWEDGAEKWVAAGKVHGLFPNRSLPAEPALPPPSPAAAAAGSHPPTSGGPSSAGILAGQVAPPSWPESPAPAMPAQLPTDPQPRFYTARGGQQFGPFTAPQLQQWATAGQLPPTDHIAQEGATTWTPAGDLPWLFPPRPFVDAPTSSGPRRSRVASGRKTNRTVAAAIGTAIVLLLCLVGGYLFLNTQLGSMISTAASASKRPTKAEFRQKWEKLTSHEISAGCVVEADVIQAFGKPDRTQTIGRNTIWYWPCQDGEMQMVIEDYSEPALFQVFPGKHLLREPVLNDY